MPMLAAIVTCLLSIQSGVAKASVMFDATAKLSRCAGRFPTHKHCNRLRQLQKVNFGGLQFEPKAVARMLRVSLLYRVEWAGRFVRKDAPDGTTAD
ncbi:hypothetical protein [Bradyrhizobium sp. sBnM-33]|uniref:hypothetical protein n=1 Tax=Bradyrhizobium sp. sBnM-33 TaxID=2831780 RepID=UPI001BD0E35A|nr:hypothetical protein [Bradyrhizobium sp. sBnM-33]WOH54850.1 hypothetical protein RX328_04190 [Bradyrhizobium sp. sBnM-33]